MGEYAADNGRELAHGWLGRAWWVRHRRGGAPVLHHAAPCLCSPQASAGLSRRGRSVGTVEPLADAAYAVLVAHPDGLAVARLVRAVKSKGVATASRGVVERALDRDGRFVQEDVLGKPTWRLAALNDISDPVRASSTDGAAPAGPVDLPVSPAAPLAGLELRDWQVEAFAAWAAAGCRGVVEAVTGTGKTRLALAAVRACLARGGRALVLVPTLDLVQQWRRELSAHVGGARIGQLGGGEADDLHDHHVLVATPHSAAALPVDLPTGAVGLLVADEAHRYGAQTWGAALKAGFAMRLALTATYERTDDGLVEILAPYFGGVVYGYGFARAAADGTIAPFDVVFAGVDLTGDERAAYDVADARAREHRRTLVGHGLPRSPLELIAAAARLVAAAEGRPPTQVAPQVAAARGYLSALRARREVAAQAGGKLALVRALAPVLERGGQRALVFTDTVEQAEAAAIALRAGGVAAEELHGGLERARRRIRLAQFRRGALQVVVAPRVLDEGVDVPDAELAVVLAAFRSRRQMVQRLGRVLRVKPDGRAARLVIGYARGTREDPAEGAQEDFLREVTGVAHGVTIVDATDLGRTVADRLRP